MFGGKKNKAVKSIGKINTLYSSMLTLEEKLQYKRNTLYMEYRELGSSILEILVQDRVLRHLLGISHTKKWGFCYDDVTTSKGSEQNETKELKFVMRIYIRYIENNRPMYPSKDICRISMFKDSIVILPLYPDPSILHMNGILFRIHGLLGEELNMPVTAGSLPTVVDNVLFNQISPNPMKFSLQ